jgi:hypothetical protein
MEKTDEALEELAVFEKLHPAQARQVREQLGTALTPSSSKTATNSQGASQEFSALHGGPHHEMAQAARDLLVGWGVPIDDTTTDCALLDDLINRFAPDGDFPIQGTFSQLSIAGPAVVARVFALHVGSLLVAQGVGSWGPETDRGLVLVSSRDQIRIPLENFVRDRILLGASGDNFSSLESLVVELRQGVGQAENYVARNWWVVAGESLIRHYHERAAWTREVLAKSGFSSTGALSDLEALDTWIDATFEPGGGITEEARNLIGSELERFIEGLGLLVGETIARHVSCEWYEHDKSDGISLLSPEIGRFFPVARVHRRVFLASAADFSSKLSSLAWSVAVASVTERIRSGALTGKQAVRSALVDRLPSIQTFSDAELSGVVDSLLIGASLGRESA